jgi:hypothetical protein
MALANPKAVRFIDETTGAAGNSINSLRRVRDVSNEIALLDANNTALVALLRKLRKKKCSDVKFEWFEDTFPVTTVTAKSFSTADTSLDFSTDIKYVRVGDLWMNGDSGEIFYILEIASNSATVTRGVGSTTAVDVESSDMLYYIGNAQQTGDTARTPLTTQTSNVYNYAQLFKEAFEVDNTANATKLYGGPELQYLRYKHAQVHNRDLERAFWFGVRDDVIQTSKDSRIAYMTRGLVADGTNGFITTNQSTSNSSGEYTEDEFDIDLQTAFRYGNGVKFMFCSPMALSVVSSWGRDVLRTVPRENTLGVNIVRYVSPHGELNLINEKLWQDYSAAGTVWQAGQDYSKMAVILDMENIWMRTLRDTVLEMNIQENDRDTQEDQYLTETGLEVHNEETCMAIFGFDLT